MFGYIYKTTNLINNKIYIGQKRGIFNKDYYGSGKILNKAIKKYGIHNFKLEFICECADKNELDEMEKYYIQKFNSLTENNNYNIANGGHGDNGIKGKTYEEYYGKEKSKIIKDKFNRIGRNNSMYGKMHINKEKFNVWQKEKSYVEKYGEDRAIKILEKKRKSMLGKKHTTKTKNKMRESQLEYYQKNPDRQKGKNNGNYGKKHEGLNKGSKHTEESKKKMSDSAKLRKHSPHTEETKLKIKLALKKFHERKK